MRPTRDTWWLRFLGLIVRPLDRWWGFALCIGVLAVPVGYLYGYRGWDLAQQALFGILIGVAYKALEWLMNQWLDRKKD